MISNPDHKTSPLIGLTTAGRKTLTDINGAATASNDVIEREFTPESVEQLRVLLRRFTTIVKATASG